VDGPKRIVQRDIEKETAMKAKWVACAAIAMGVASGAMAEPVEWSIAEGGNGHTYEVFENSNITWDAAQSVAESMGGYLATITSLGENGFIIDDLLGESPGYRWYFIGGYQPEGRAEPDGDWRWITGEPWGYTNWDNNEPNNGINTPDEDALQINWFPSSMDDNGQWNDCFKDTVPVNNTGYIVEIPEPATLSLLAIGGLALIRRKRK